MAALADADRSATWADCMRQLSRDGDAIAVTKAELRAAVDALDDFLVANAAALNTALPAAARTGLTASQKARLFALVIAKRYVTGA